MRIRAVLCDLGGVLVLYDETEIVRKIESVAARRVDSPEVAQDLLRLKERSDRGTIGPEGFFRELKRILGLRVGYEEFVEIWCDNFWLNDDAISAIKWLGRERRLVLVSNTDVLHWKYLDRKYGLAKLFDGVVLSYRVGVVKPEPEIYKIALEKAGVTPGEAVFVDDIEENVEAARKLGMAGILYQPGVDLVGEIEGIERGGPAGKRHP